MSQAIIGLLPILASGFASFLGLGESERRRALGGWGRRAATGPRYLAFGEAGRLGEACEWHRTPKDEFRRGR